MARKSAGAEEEMNLKVLALILAFAIWPKETLPPYINCDYPWALSAPPSPSESFRAKTKALGYSHIGISWYGPVPPMILVNVRVQWSGSPNDGGYWLHAAGCSTEEAENGMLRMLKSFRPIRRLD